MKGLLKDTPATKGPGHDEPAGWLKDPLWCFTVTILSLFGFIGLLNKGS